MSKAETNPGVLCKCGMPFMDRRGFAAHTKYATNDGTHGDDGGFDVESSYEERIHRFEHANPDQVAELRKQGKWPPTAYKRRKGLLPPKPKKKPKTQKPTAAKSKFVGHGSEGISLIKFCPCCGLDIEKVNQAMTLLEKMKA